MLESDFREKLERHHAPFCLRAKYEEYLKTKRSLKRIFSFPDGEIETSIRQIYLDALNSIKSLKINSEEYVRVVEFAQVFNDLCAAHKPDIRCKPVKSREALIVLDSLGFHERKQSTGNYTYVRVRLIDVAELLVKIHNYEPIGVLITLNKIKSWNNQHKG
jgi:hypothetical protein